MSPRRCHLARRQLVARPNCVGCERRLELLGVGTDALVLRGEVLIGPFVADVGERVGLTHEARRAGAVRDPRGEAVVVGEVERLLGRDAQTRARVGVVADHRRVHRHRDPSGLLRVLGVAHPEQESALEEVEDALEDLLLMLGGGAELGEVLQPERRLEAGGAVGGDLVDDVLAAGDVVRLVDEQRHPWSFGLG